MQFSIDEKKNQIFRHSNYTLGIFTATFCRIHTWVTIQTMKSEWDDDISTSIHPSKITFCGWKSLSTNFLLLHHIIREWKIPHTCICYEEQEEEIHRCMKNHMVRLTLSLSTSWWVNEDRKFSSNVVSGMNRHREWEQKGTKWLWNFLVYTWRCYQIIMLFTSNKNSLLHACKVLFHAVSENGMGGWHCKRIVSC